MEVLFTNASLKTDMVIIIIDILFLTLTLLILFCVIPSLGPLHGNDDGNNVATPMVSRVS